MKVDDEGFNALERALRRVTGRHFSTAWTLLRHPGSGPYYIRCRAKEWAVCSRRGHAPDSILPFICGRCMVSLVD